MHFIHRFRRFHRYGFLCVFVTSCLIPIRGFAEDRGHGPNASFVSQIDALLSEPGLKGGFQGVVIRSLKDGATWYERNPDTMFIPASNEKLLTSSSVLNTLGPNWKYVTRLVRDGVIDSDGTLHGRLILVGSGDPLLADKDLDALVDAAKTVGIKRVDGDVIADESRFDSVRYGDGWSWDDMSFYYSAQVSALNLNGNMIQIHTDPGRAPGDAVRIKVTPTLHYVKFINRAKTVAKGEKTALVISRELGGNRVTITGPLALDAKPDDHKPVGVTVEDPARYAAVVFAEKLRLSGILTDGIGVGQSPPSAIAIGIHESPPLSEILKRLNKPSDNLVAECLLKTLGAEKSAKGIGTWASGREAANSWFASIGMDANGIDMTDGSGLSRQTFATPHNLAVLLKTMYSHPDSKAFIDSLPIAGVDGTLRNRMKGTAAEGNCRAKTGTLSSVSSLSGYVTTADGEPLLFVILMNNHKARASIATGVQNKIVELLASWKKTG